MVSGLVPRLRSTRLTVRVQLLVLNRSATRASPRAGPHPCTVYSTCTTIFAHLTVRRCMRRLLPCTYPYLRKSNRGIVVLTVVVAHVHPGTLLPCHVICILFHIPLSLIVVSHHLSISMPIPPVACLASIVCTCFNP